MEQIAAVGVEIEDDGIIHIAIESEGELQLGAYDNLGEGCVFTGPAVPPSQLEQWRARGLITSFMPEPKLQTKP